MPSSGSYFSAISFCLIFCVCGLLSSACRIVAPFASGVCPLVVKVGPGACACPLVGEVGSCPYGGRAMSRGVFRGGCELSTTLGSLSSAEIFLLGTLLLNYEHVQSF